MKYIKIIMICVLVTITLISGLLIIVKHIDKKEKEISFENTVTMEVENTIDILKNRNEFFAVKSCIIKYLSYMLQEDTELIYSVLDDNYIEQYNVKKEDVLQDIKKYEEPVFYSSKTYVMPDSISLYTYFVYGRVLDKITGKMEDFNIVVRLDKENDVFSILPYKYIEDNNYNIQIGNTITFKYNKIKDKKYNSFEFENITDEEMALLYTDEVKDNILYDAENFYNKLDEEYKNKRFNNIEEYMEYVDKHISKIYSAKMQKFQKYSYKGYNQYICIDQNENYYIINEIQPGQYTVILDTYTIDLPEYIEKYNKANDQQKTAYCINRFMRGSTR